MKSNYGKIKEFIITKSLEGNDKLFEDFIKLCKKNKNIIKQDIFFNKLTNNGVHQDLYKEYLYESISHVSDIKQQDVYVSNSALMRLLNKHGLQSKFMQYVSPKEKLYESIHELIENEFDINILNENYTLLKECMCQEIKHTEEDIVEKEEHDVLEDVMKLYEISKELKKEGLKEIAEFILKTDDSTKEKFINEMIDIMCENIKQSDGTDAMIQDFRKKFNTLKESNINESIIKLHELMNDNDE